MIICIDFDGTLVDDDQPYDDLAAPLVLKAGAREAVYAMRRAGHTLVLVSSRSNRALREDWRLNPLWKHALVPFSLERWERSLHVNKARYEQMLSFVGSALPDIFSSIDDGMQGKISADVYIDDRAVRYGTTDWFMIRHSYGVDAIG